MIKVNRCYLPEGLLTTHKGLGHQAGEEQQLAEVFDEGKGYTEWAVNKGSYKHHV